MLATEVLHDRVIRLRIEGLSYQQIADHIGVGSPREAQRLYRAARARQIPLEHRPRRLPTPPLEIVAWAAGFFDGEGCVSGYEGLQSGKWRRFTFAVQVSQVDPAPLRTLELHWGGSIRFQASKNPNHQDQWAWAIRGQDAAAFLADLLPHLRVKRAAAEVAIPCLHRTHQHGVRLFDAEVEQRRVAVAFLRKANSRGEARDR